VRKSGIDPFDHYRRFGRREGRIPGPCFAGDPNAIQRSARVDADWAFLEKIRTAATQSQIDAGEPLTRPRLRDAVPGGAVVKDRDNRPHPALARNDAATMNIVIINHGSYDNNSAIHITGFANALTALGHRVVVSATGVSTDAGDLGVPRFRCVPHQSLADNPGMLTEYFADARRIAPDLVHCWSSLLDPPADRARRHSDRG
jgi:hypothetical protein